MTGKRFIQFGDIHIKDTVTGEEWYAPCETTLMDLLNEQQSIIEYLTIEKHQADKRFQTIIAELKKENEQLKQKLENLNLNEKNDIIKKIDGKVFIRM